MKNPVLLDGHTVEPKAILHPSGMSLSLQEQQTDSATMTLFPSDPALSVGDWVRVYSPQGDAGVFYVKSIETDYTGGNKRTVSLSHTYDLLDNCLVSGKVDPGGMDSDDNPKKCLPATAIRKALAAQDTEIWTLGSCSYADDDSKQSYEFNDQSVKSCIETVTKTLDDYQIRLDCGSLPFTLNIVKRPTAPVCEMRLNRNISTIRVTVDRSDMINRLYAIGNKDLRLSGDGYVEDADSIAAYGLCAKCQTDQGITSVSELKAWANTVLKKYKDPSVVVTISGLELSETTGLSFDKLTVGTVCRVPLPDYGTSVTDRITQLSWADVIGSPESVTVTLSNTRQAVTRLTDKINAVAASTTASGGGGGGGAGNRNSGEIDNAIYDEETGAFSRIEQNLGYIRATVAGIAGVGISTVSQLSLTADNIKLAIYGKDGKTISGIQTSLSKVEGNVKSVMDIYDDLVNIHNALKVGDTITADRTIVSKSNMRCVNLIASGTLSCKYGTLAKSTIKALTGYTWKAGSVTYANGGSECDIPTSLTYKTDLSGNVVTKFISVKVVKEVKLPSLSCDSTNYTVAAWGATSE